jgi:16S rRNA (guanine966-N2)-methyltransferase
VRIVAGTRKGHRIAAPKGAATRPTGDRVREAVFSIVGSVDGAAVLDLFAGSGAMGLEALSRGAASCVFVERDREAARIIRANLEKLRLTGATVVARDVAAALRDERGRGRRYDLVLVDPPYDGWERHEPTLAELLPAVAAENALVVVETDERVEPSLPLDLVTTRRYGSARITVFSP